LAKTAFLIFAYGRNIGVIALFLPLGIFSIRNKRNPNAFFIYLILFLFSPIISSWYYTLSLLLPLFDLISTDGFVFVADRLKSKRQLLFTTVLIFSVLFSILSQFYHPQSYITGVANHIEPGTYNLIEFINANLNSKIIGMSQSHVVRKVASLSEQPIIYSAEEVFFVHNLVDTNNFKMNPRFDASGRRFFLLEYSNPVRKFEDLHANGLNYDNKKELREYDISYLLYDKENQNQPSTLSKDVEQRCMKVYDNKNEFLYYLGAPSGEC
jgi:hypothetical protein